ncbi:unnamed protein product [Cuscuta epithymum]|uniref:Uncharacterized protein n=1 Tax=Cuscuta epithymum TaxID=186058 RepID=A0AAV0CB25_9ASTE|nr:unnamed protein product [Cuscuta epithymum]
MHYLGLLSQRWCFLSRASTMSAAGAFFRFRLCRRSALLSLGRWCSAGVQVRHGGRRSVEEGGFAFMARGDRRCGQGSRMRRCCRWRRSAPPIRLLWSHRVGMSLVMHGLWQPKVIDQLAWYRWYDLLLNHHHGMYEVLEFVNVFLVVFICLLFVFLCPFLLFVLTVCLSCFASLYVIGYGWIYGNKFGCVKPTTWLAIRVALSRVTVSKSHHRVTVVVVGVSVGVSFIFPLLDVTILNLLI